jgi:uncharacterized protein (UPF0210 family)
MLSKNEIFETIRMIQNQNLDVRTITLSLSLLDCITDNADKTAEKVYKKVAAKAGGLVKTGGEIALEYGIPIVNKRVSVTPVSLVGASSGGYEKICLALDRAAAEIGVDFIGGYTALVSKGMSKGEREFLDTIPSALAKTKKICGSVNAASTKCGINMDAVRILGEKIKELAALTAKEGSIGCAKFVVFCNAVEDNPFMAGAFTGVSEGDGVINVGVSGPGVVQSAIRALGKAADFSALAEEIKRTAFKITRAGTLLGREAAKRLGFDFGIVDLSLAPTPKAGDSVAHILEEMGLESVGAPGTTAALALLNDAVKKCGVMASSGVGWLSGAFIPVSEDIGMIEAVRRGALSIEKLEAMTAVCSVGLDMIAVPGDTPASAISALIADECAIGLINNKTTAVRVIPAVGKKMGDEVEFGGLLGRAPVMRINPFGSGEFIARGGRIPAPIHSNKN